MNHHSAYSAFAKCLSVLVVFISLQVTAQDLHSVENFGSNPGEVEMHLFIPPSIKHAENFPLLVAVHGCNHSAKMMAKQSGLNKLAREHRFAILYPQQRMKNNAARCWNWFNEEDVTAESGELHSIRQMIDFTLKHYKVDSSEVYLYGVSSGGAMASALMANYPETFQAGCVYAGGPYGVTSKRGKAMMQMTSPDTLSNEHLANAVLSLHKEKAPHYPDVVIVHGLKDPIVHPLNGTMVARQWCEVHATDTTACRTLLEDREDLKLSVWKDELGNSPVKLLEIEKMMHCLAIDPGDGPKQGGKKTIFSYDFDFFSTYWIVDEFGLTSP